MAVTSTQMNNIVLEYLVQEGYQRAAETFALENGIDLVALGMVSTQVRLLIGAYSGVQLADVVQEYLKKQASNGNIHAVDNTSYLQPPAKIRQGYATISQRKKIKDSILDGNITGAIQEIIDNFPTVLDSDNLLHFKLLKLNLTEMIRNHKLNPDVSADQERDFLSRVLLFVRDNLINKVANSTALLKELEVTMSLLCFDFLAGGLDSLPVELRGLLDISLRKECWKFVNLVILDARTSDFESRLLTLSTYPQFDFSGSAPLETTASKRHYQIDYDYSIPVKDNPCVSSGDKTPSDDEVNEPDTAIPPVLESRLERLARFNLVTKRELEKPS